MYMKPKLLIVEDNAELADILKMHAEMRDYIPFNAFSIQEAKEILNKERVSRIILDLKLPGEHGLELIAHLKKSPWTENIPITIFSAQDDETTTQLSFLMGADRFVPKPSSIDAVFNPSPSNKPI